MTRRVCVESIETLRVKERVVAEPWPNLWFGDRQSQVVVQSAAV